MCNRFQKREPLFAKRVDWVVRRRENEQEHAVGTRDGQRSGKTGHLATHPPNEAHTYLGGLKHLPLCNRASLQGRRPRARGAWGSWTSLLPGLGPGHQPQVHGLFFRTWTKVSSPSHGTVPKALDSPASALQPIRWAGDCPRTPCQEARGSSDCSLRLTQAQGPGEPLSRTLSALQGVRLEEGQQDQAPSSLSWLVLHFSRFTSWLEAL